MSWMQTYTGQRVSFHSPHPLSIDPIDIAVALSRQPRFAGHTRWPYSVAQHCVQASRCDSAFHAREKLVHDAAEAYTMDLVRPLKDVLGGNLRDVEDRLNRAIANRFNVLYPWPAEVHVVDDRMLATEVRDLVDRPSWSPAALPYDWRITPWKRSKALRKFVERFEELFGETIDRSRLPPKRGVVRNSSVPTRKTQGGDP